MNDLEAISLACELARRPNLTRRMQQRPIPAGCTDLLRIAAGDVVIISDTSQRTGVAPERLRDAAVFFVQQILFHPQSDSYRVLGCRPDSSEEELRRNMAILVRWLHPDALDTSSGTPIGFDSTVFLNRVTRAWEDLKTEDRRRNYDQGASRSSSGFVPAVRPVSDPLASPTAELAWSRIEEVSRTAKPAARKIAAAVAQASRNAPPRSALGRLLWRFRRR